uniref:zinc finger protein ZAT9-like n=1 Tax=Erigeron canadensis TaxID=72917 RepID=UPI001CB91ABC|nr:zinc finger protein ZAT9-like [Erigeron canadensis]
MEEEHDELRYVCKLCDKRYPSGKSLGGHMRSHVIAAAVNLAESDDKFEQVKKISTLIINGNENANSNSYGLRENPKKSWRAVGSSSSTLPFPNEKVCKQCGKGFQSLKALCGHMAFHSDKDRSLKDYDHSWTVTSDNLDNDQDKLLIEDSHSDTEENELGQDDNDDEEDDPVCVTRSKTKRYKKLVVKPSCYSLNYANCTSNNSNYNNGSSSVSEIDELEQEELAICLMMLSKDSTNWGGVNSVVESSDNNSVVETKLSSMELKNCRKEWNMAKNETESYPFENSNTEYCKNGTKKVESDISVEEQLRNGDQQKNASKEDNGFDYKNLTYAEKQEIRRNLFREFGYDEFLEKRIRDSDDSYYPDREGPYKKKNKYECMNCNKVFSSFQGLGGHRPCHKKNNAFGSGGNSSDVEYARSQKAKYEKKIKPKKNKGHECPICFRMFKSGQALGGHKRSHFLNGTADRMDYMAPIGYEEPVYNDMIDLNLPAPEED